MDSNGVRRSGALMDRARAKVSSFYFSNRIPAVTPAELAAAHHDGAAHEALATTPASPEWEGQLHGGADERAETDAYAPHAHEDGEAREAEPPRRRPPRPADRGRIDDGPSPPPREGAVVLSRPWRPYPPPRTTTQQPRAPAPAALCPLDRRALVRGRVGRC